MKASVSKDVRAHRQSVAVLTELSCHRLIRGKARTCRQTLVSVRATRPSARRGCLCLTCHVRSLRCRFAMLIESSAVDPTQKIQTPRNLLDLDAEYEKVRCCRSDGSQCRQYRNKWMTDREAKRVLAELAQDPTIKLPSRLADVLQVSSLDAVFANLIRRRSPRSMRLQRTRSPSTRTTAKRGKCCEASCGAR